MSALPQEVVDEMVSFVRDYAVGVGTTDHLQRARDLVAKLPTPVDPDVEEAERLSERWYCADSYTTREAMRCLAKEALKRGRTLQQEESSNG